MRAIAEAVRRAVAAGADRDLQIEEEGVVVVSRSIACIVGARPNFVKMGPILAGLRRRDDSLRPILIHTGQHYDETMSALFFRELGLPTPDLNLAVGSGHHGAQTARIIEAYEAWLLAADVRPEATLVVGDVNSTLATAIASIKLGVPIVHVEAGLRSFDRAMPEEINRVVTDALSDLLLVSEPSGVENLQREGRPAAAIRLVGNVMIDVLFAQLPAARALGQPEKMGLPPGGYALVTLHRPANVDDPARLSTLMALLARTARRLPVVFPVHPRTKARLQSLDGCAHAAPPGLHLCDPFGYREFLGLSSQAKLVVTDSGGLQEETTALGIPCLTMRPSTERPLTVVQGSSTLVGDDLALLETLIDEVLAGKYKHGRCPPLWDGHAGDRIADEVARFLMPQRLAA